ncbi:MAG: GNAT family N-acetyltransferase [Spirochaetaceae bacterium]|jgi:predicted acetyltransferase|nr:GNAT family N-acetyltransferase [Spirochaetaceae bacterium]
MIEVRRLNPEEMPLVYRMRTVVYNGRRDYSRDEKPDPLTHPACWHWGAFLKGKMVSSMVEIPFLMRFDGSGVPMSGIGGVGTLPEARNAGCVPALFAEFLSEAYERGAVFSSLTPFSHSYYRSFGYELACARNEITLPVGEFSRLKAGGSFTQVFPGDDTAALAEVHSAYIAGLNHGIHRDHWPDNRAWRIFTREDPYSTGTFLYLWQDEEGRPRSYIKYQDQTVGDEHIMSVQELAFTDREALYGALALVKGLATQFRKFKWLMPTFLDPADLVNNPWEITQRLLPRDMTRIINVKRALELMRRPGGEGEYSLELVDDPYIPANKGRWRVEFGKEGSRVSSTAAEPDLLCDLPSLSQLVTGYRTLENALRTRRAGLEYRSNRETLDRVFTWRPQHITEYF